MKLTDFMVEYMSMPSIKDAEFYISRGSVTINCSFVDDIDHYMENTSRVKILDYHGGVIKEAWFCVAREK